MKKLLLGIVVLMAINIMSVSVFAVGLTTAEKTGILYMREEEKLARDVYITLYNKWKLGIFSNISNCEQMHMDAVKTLIDKYGLTDPAKNKGIGQFTNQFLQNLYNVLIAHGNQSITNALWDGGDIEDVDIYDLNRFSKETNKSDILNVYGHLTQGSYHHIRAFTSSLKSYGITYVPTYLTIDEYNAIISGSNSGCGGGGGGCGPGGRGGSN